MYIERLRWYMPYYDVSNLVNITKTNMIDKIPCAYWTLSTTAARIWHEFSCRAMQWSQLLSKSPADLHRCLSSSKTWLFYKSYLVASWMHLHNCRCFQEHLGMLLQSLRALCLAPGVFRSIWKRLRGLVRLTRVCGRFAWGFRTDLHYADEPISHWGTCCRGQMRISPTRIWPCVLTIRKTGGISTLLHMAPYHAERNHQAIVNSHTVHRVLGFLMSPISTRLTKVWAGKMQWKQELDSNFE